MIIRAEHIHIPQIARIEAESFSDPWSERSLEAALSDEMNIFLADISEEIVRGYIIGSFDGYSGYIERIAVASMHRRSGLGTKLLGAFEGSLSDTAESVSLDVRASNTSAVGLYSSFGFERAGIRRGMYSSPKEDGIVMIKGMIK